MRSEHAAVSDARPNVEGIKDLPDAEAEHTHPLGRRVHLLVLTFATVLMAMSAMPALGPL
jgi:hypothetical protein